MQLRIHITYQFCRIKNNNIFTFDPLSKREAVFLVPLVASQLGLFIYYTFISTNVLKGGAEGAFFWEKSWASYNYRKIGSNLGRSVE